MYLYYIFHNIQYAFTASESEENNFKNLMRLLQISINHNVPQNTDCNSYHQLY